MDASQSTRDQHDEESRFIHLLQPIRDLASNWNIDIAAELADYLEELESITFSFDGGHSTLNFAEGKEASFSVNKYWCFSISEKALPCIVKNQRASYQVSFVTL